MRLVPKNQSTTRKRLPRALRAFGHWLLALAVVFGIVHSGGRYFYCEALGLMPADPCAAASSDTVGTSPVSLLTEHTQDCCEVVTLRAVPKAARAATPRVAQAACVATLPALWFAAPAAAAGSSLRERLFDEWRPPPRASSDARAQLMVFLI